MYPPRKYIGKGLSIAVILLAKKLFQKTIISSSEKAKTFIHESRRTDATEKVWKRLQVKGLAGYDIKRDVFYTT